MKYFIFSRNCSLRIEVPQDWGGIYLGFWICLKADLEGPESIKHVDI